MRLVLKASILAAAAGCSSPSRDTSNTPPSSSEKVAQWTATATAPRAGAHESRVVDVALKMNVTEGWHVYSLTQLDGGPTPMKVTVSPPYQLTGDVSGPSPVKAKDNNFGIETETYSGDQIFKFAVELPDTKADVPPIEVKVRSQACSDNLCLPAKTTTIKVTPGSST